MACVRDFYEVPTYTAMTLVAYLCPDWSTLQIVAGVICGAALLTWPLISESARWLTQNDRVDEAREILVNIAKGNRRRLDEDNIAEIDQVLSRPRHIDSSEARNPRLPLLSPSQSLVAPRASNTL